MEDPLISADEESQLTLWAMCDLLSYFELVSTVNSDSALYTLLSQVIEDACKYVRILHLYYPVKICVAMFRHSDN